MFAISNLAIVPLRIEPSDRSEMVSQVLFGEHFKIIEQNKKWSKIELTSDNYQGWIDNKQFMNISKEEFDFLENSNRFFNGDLIEYITNDITHMTS